MTSSSAARLFLKLNSQYSALCGVILLLAAGTLAAAMFADPADWAAPGLRVLAVGLLGFGGVLYLLSKDRYLGRGVVYEISALDALWVVGSAFLIALWGDLLTSTGITIIVGVAMIVAVFAVGQVASALRIEAPVPAADVSVKDGLLLATVKREVNAPADIVWQVMTDHPAYADVASNIAKVEVVSGDGLGMVRRCYDPKGESWKETCDVYEPGKSYGFRIHTDAHDYPYPIEALSGRWSVTPGPGGSEFDIEITAKPKGNALARWLFVTVAKRQFRAVLIDLADGWAVRMEQEAKG